MWSGLCHWIFCSHLAYSKSGLISNSPLLNWQLNLNVCAKSGYFTPPPTTENSQLRFLIASRGTWCPNDPFCVHSHWVMPTSRNSLRIEWWLFALIVSFSFYNVNFLYQKKHFSTNEFNSKGVINDTLLALTANFHLLLIKRLSVLNYFKGLYLY